MKAGVYNSQFSVDLSGTEQLYRDLAEIAKSHKVSSEEFTKTANSIKEGELDGEEIMGKLSEGLLYLLEMEKDKCPKEIYDYLSASSAFLRRSRYIHRYVRRGYVSYARTLGTMKRFPVHASPREYLFWERTRGDEFKSHRLEDVKDVLWIVRQEPDEGNLWLLDITTIKEEGTRKFVNFVKSIPHIGKTMKEIKKRRTFSSRFTFRPYSLAVSLWLEDQETSTVVHEDLRNFLQAAIRYYSNEEWRTSIVLSAITVESMLADLYEEKYQDYAPNVPLGELYKEVTKKMTFPQEIARNIMMANEARISAVHRSRLPVSEREATNALFGATTFTLWYFSQY